MAREGVFADAEIAMRYLIRASDLDQMQGIIERIKSIAEGSTLMTEISVEDKILSRVSNLLGNHVSEKVCRSSLKG